jgi:BirA family biotin operon repressor/biotin-[acetyl-CoA-carboxylase] ligase
MFIKKSYHYKELDSSSTYIKRRRSFLKNLTFVSCDYQTAGHGRMNRTWNSNKGENLTFSFIVKDKKLIKKVNGLSVLMGACVFKALNTLAIKNLSIKWPNDVYSSDKKICGVLLESVIGDDNDNCVIVGIGINVNQTEFKGDFKAPPTSVKLETNKTVDIKKFKKTVYKIIKKELKLYKKDKSDFLSVANQNNYLFGKTVYAEIKGKKKEVTCKNINSDGTLCVLESEKVLSLLSGEVTFHV